MLNGYRALDLTDEKGFLCGKILADLGADVIKIEKPSGSAARRIGPFYQDIPEPEKSLFWFAYNTSKRGITLNIETPEGKGIFKKLVRSADFVLESFPSNYLDSLGLGYSTLGEINPRIIMASITPFGQEGPYRDYKAPDIVVEAMSGMLYVKGAPDRPPLRFSVEQTYPMAGVHATVGLLIAHHYRELTGEGQHVDVSMREAFMSALLNINAFWWMLKLIPKREGMVEIAQLIGGSRFLRRPVLFRCKDGQVSHVLVTAQMANREIALVNWMDAEGMAGDLKDIDWRIDMKEVTQEQHNAWLESTEKFFMTHTKAELHEEAAKRGLLIYPVSTTKDILGNKQLKARNFWREVEHRELGVSITYPGPPFKSTEDKWKISCRAPLIGEHNLEIYEKELGFSREELSILAQHNVI